MIITNDDETAARIKMIVSHGSSRKYYHEILGVCSRLDSIQAAILNVKLDYLDDYCNSRIKAANKYNKIFEGKIDAPFVSPNVKHIFHQYSVRVDRRNELQEYLKTKGIPAMIYYPVPLHLQEAYRYNYKEGDYPVSERVAKDIISFPMHTELTDGQINYISEEVLNFISH